MSFTYLKGRSILPLSRTDYDRHLRMDVSRPEDRVPDIGDVQGDAVYGMSKEAENFIFFRIENATLFKTKLRDFRPTSAADVSKHLHDIEKEKKEAAESEPKRAPKRVEYGAQWWQIGFTRMGLNLILDKPETSIGEDRFDKRRMRDDKTYLGDLSDWEKIFDTKIFDEEHGSAGNDQDALHGVIIVFEASEEKCKETSRKALDIFGSSIKEVGSIMGKNRPDQWRKHEHFGYMDGISQPVMRGVGEKAIKPYLDVDPGVIVIGHTGDSLLKKRPDWAKDGTMMVFRKLEQDVIGFDNYVKERGKNWKDFIPEGNPGPELSEQEGIDLYGARLIGRWKSGAPLARCPYRDNQDIFADEEETKKISEDPDRINDFDYVVDDVAGISANAPSNYYCPFTAHTRKTVPRNLHPYIDKSLLEAGGIVRAGIPYGDEVTKEERDAYDPDNHKKSPRGLLFVCYASSLDQGFVRQSVEYGNNNYFPTTSFVPTNHGQDPIIGYSPEAPSNGALLHAATSFNNGDQVEIQFQSDEKYLSVSGFVKAKPRDFVRPPAEKYFVTSRGGEYFFMPSIPTLEDWAGVSEDGE